MPARKIERYVYKEIAVLIGAAIVFTWFGWFATSPKTPEEQLSTVSLGVGLAVGIYFLDSLDELARTKLGRFGVDAGIGAAMLAFIYIFMLGTRFYLEFVVGAVLAVLIIAGLFSLRPLPKHVER